MKKLFVLLFKINILFSQTNNPEILDSRLINAVVQIAADTTFGTGFLIRSGEKTLLVTNKHVIGDWNPIDPMLFFNKIKVTLYSGNAEQILPLTIELNISKNGIPFNEVKIHESEKIDIAVIDISNQIKELVKRFWLSNTNFIDTSKLIRLNKINHMVSYGSQVFAIGYPAGIKSFLTNQPIVKTVNISSSLDGKLIFQQQWKNRNKDSVNIKTEGSVFIVDGNIVGGNSGGPIITSKQIIHIEANNQVLKSKGMDNYIIGIVSNIWKNQGLTLVFSSDNIQEVIRQFD